MSGILVPRAGTCGEQTGAGGLCGAAWAGFGGECSGGKVSVCLGYYRISVSKIKTLCDSLSDYPCKLRRRPTISLVWQVNKISKTSK